MGFGFRKSGVGYKAIDIIPKAAYQIDSHQVLRTAIYYLVCAEKGAGRPVYIVYFV
jgi:hypothetical protein